MNEIRRLLKVAAARMETSAFIERAHQAAIAVAALALLLILVDRLPGEAFMPWMGVAPALIVLGLAAAIAMWARERPDEMHVAVLVDERLDLREKLSTALQVGESDDPFARAAMEDAVAAARDPRHYELARRQFPMNAPRGWWISPLLALLVLAGTFLPQMDAFAREEQASPEMAEARVVVAETLDAIVQELQQKPHLSEELADLLGDLAHEPRDRDGLRSPDEIRRDAIKRITDLNDRLEEIVSGERGKSMESLEKAMSQLRSPEDGPGKEFAEALKKGNFAAAQEALKELMDQLESGEMSEADREALAEMLKDIAAQLEKLAEQQRDLEESLRQAGLDPQLAQNPEALQKALEQSQNLTEQQRQQLAQMAQAQRAAMEMCKSLGGACMNLAQGLQSGSAAAGNLQQQLSQLEQMQMLLNEARLASGMCQGMCQGLGQGLSLQGAMAGWGQGMGQGQGGGLRPTAPTPTRTREVRAEGHTGEGDIIARMLVEGPQVIGESVIEPSVVVREIIEGLEQALEEEQLPRKYHETQKHYFGELERRTRAIEEERRQARPSADDEDER
jgi:hypothetical protein